MRGVGGAPRGLRAHQQPLRKRDRHRRPTRLPKNQNTQGKQAPTPPKRQEEAGRTTGSRQANRKGGRLATRAKKQASRRPICRNRQHARPPAAIVSTHGHISYPSPLQRVQTFQSKQSKWQRAKKAKIAAEQNKTDENVQSEQGLRGWSKIRRGSSKMTLPTSFSSRVQRVQNAGVYGRRPAAPENKGANYVYQKLEDKKRNE